MHDAFTQITTWSATGESALCIAGASLVALSFVAFNAIRIFLYLPQLLSCWNDANGCSAINLGTWSSWIFANLSTSMYMWLFQHDLLGACLNAGNAAMCAATVAVTLVKRRRWRGRSAADRRPAGDLNALRADGGRPA
jgi:hypothetical protein